MKEKAIGIFAIVIGVLAFYDALHMVKVGTIPIRPFLVPVLCIGIGWMELHGRNIPLKNKCHHSHIVAITALAGILILIWRATH